MTDISQRPEPGRVEKVARQRYRAFVPGPVGVHQIDTDSRVAAEWLARIHLDKWERDRAVERVAELEDRVKHLESFDYVEPETRQKLTQARDGRIRELEAEIAQLTEANRWTLTKDVSPECFRAKLLRHQSGRYVVGHWNGHEFRRAPDNLLLEDIVAWQDIQGMTFEEVES